MKTAQVLAMALTILVASSPVAVAPTYECGNHNPKHGASTPQEAKEIAKKYKCEKWDVRGTVTKEEREKALKELRAVLDE